MDVDDADRVEIPGEDVEVVPVCSRSASIHLGMWNMVHPHPIPLPQERGRGPYARGDSSSAALEAVPDAAEN
jgi:hypothetical protein